MVAPNKDDYSCVCDAGSNGGALRRFDWVGKYVDYLEDMHPETEIDKITVVGDGICFLGIANRWAHCVRRSPICGLRVNSRMWGFA